MIKLVGIPFIALLKLLLFALKSIQVNMARTSSSILDQFDKIYRCKKCKHVSNSYGLGQKKPSKCENKGKKCDGREFEHLTGEDARPWWSCQYHERTQETAFAARDRYRIKRFGYVPINVVKKKINLPKLTRKGPRRKAKTDNAWLIKYYKKK